MRLWRVQWDSFDWSLSWTSDGTFYRRVPLYPPLRCVNCRRWWPWRTSPCREHWFCDLCIDCYAGKDAVWMPEKLFPNREGKPNP